MGPSFAAMDAASVIVTSTAKVLLIRRPPANGKTIEYSLEKSINEISEKIGTVTSSEIFLEAVKEPYVQKLHTLLDPTHKHRLT